MMTRPRSSFEKEARAVLVYQRKVGSLPLATDQKFGTSSFKPSMQLVGKLVAEGLFDLLRERKVSQLVGVKTLLHVVEGIDQISLKAHQKHL